MSRPTPELQAGQRIANLALLSDAITGEISTASLDEDASRQLLEAAVAHGVAGLFVLRTPEARNVLTAARARNLRAARFTQRVVETIERAGIPCVVLKGVLAGSRWSDPTLRQQSDVDILLERRHKDAAAKVLIHEGVCADRFVVSDQLHNDSLHPAKPSGLLVEVHHYFNNHHENRVDVAELIQRRIRVRTPLGDLPALSLEDDAVYLALHATTHALQRLAWLVDLSVLQPDWDEAARRAVQWSIASAVAPAWLRTRELLRTPIPDSALRLLNVPSWQARLSGTTLAASERTGGTLHHVLERLFRLSVVPPRSLPRVVLQKFRARREERDGYLGRT